MKFREWLKLKEVGTSTSSIAVFARPLFGGPVSTRVWPNDEEEKKKKKKPINPKY